MTYTQTAEPVPKLRRAHLAAPGEPLLLARSPIGSVLRFGRCMDDWGIGAEALLSSPMCATPLPVGPGTWDADGPRRWPGTRPEAMWHPLMWLPRRLAERQWIPDGDNVITEPLDVWSVRVAIELSTAGMWDQESGTWFDVLGSVDIDIDTADGVERVRRWLDNGRDGTLSGIDLSEHIDDSEHLGWAADVAIEAMDDLYVASWALGADDLLFDLEGMRADIASGERPPAGARSDLALVASVGGTWMADVPAELTGVDEREWWPRLAEMVATFNGPKDDFCTRVVDTAVVHLEAIRDATWPEMTRRIEAAAAAESLVIPVPDYDPRSAL